MADNNKKPETTEEDELPTTKIDTKHPMKKKLDACKKVKVRLLKAKEKEPNYATVSINGYTYQIKRGESVDVPEPVAKLLEKGGYI